MKSPIIARLARMNGRMLSLLGLAFVSLAAFEGWALVLRQPLAEYRKLVATRESLAAALAATPNMQVELGHLALQAKQLDERLNGQFRAHLPDAQLASALMAQLDGAAAEHSVTLAGMKPAGKRGVLSFEEAGFEVSARGEYIRLARWLMDFERTLGQGATVSEFTMKGGGEAMPIGVTLKLGLLRPVAGRTDK